MISGEMSLSYYAIPAEMSHNRRNSAAARNDTTWCFDLPATPKMASTASLLAEPFLLGSRLDQHTDTYTDGQSTLRIDTSVATARIYTPGACDTA